MLRNAVGEQSTSAGFNFILSPQKPRRGCMISPTLQTRKLAQKRPVLSLVAPREVNGRGGLEPRSPDASSLPLTQLPGCTGPPADVRRLRDPYRKYRLEPRFSRHSSIACRAGENQIPGSPPPESEDPQGHNRPKCAWPSHSFLLRAASALAPSPQGAASLTPLQGQAHEWSQLALPLGFLDGISSLIGSGAPACSAL